MVKNKIFRNFKNKIRSFDCCNKCTYNWFFYLIVWRFLLYYKKIKAPFEAFIFTLIDLINNLKAKKDLEIAQLNSETLLTTPENKEQTEISSTIEQNDEVNKTTIATYGSSNVERTYNFTTKLDTLKLNKQNFVTKVNKVGYEITEADIGKAIEYNVTIPGFPGLRNIAPSNRTDLLTAIQKINTNQDFRP